MIELKHLRQGNWILAGPDKQPVQVAEILADSVNTTLLKNWTPETISPIPLSPEILQTLGFEKTEDGDGGYYHELLSANGVLFVEGNKKGYTDVFIDCWEEIRVKYLHQLQNLYWCLCGKELIYKP